MTFFEPPTPDGWIPRENGKVENEDSLEYQGPLSEGGYCAPKDLDPTAGLPHITVPVERIERLNLQGKIRGLEEQLEEHRKALKKKREELKNSRAANKRLRVQVQALADRKEPRLQWPYSVDENYTFPTDKINEWFKRPKGRAVVVDKETDPGNPHFKTIHIHTGPAPFVPDRSKLLTEANDLINGDRARDYGDASINFRRIADYWNRWLGEQYDPDCPGPVNIQPSDVAMMMVFVKIAREAQGNKWDSVTDFLGYGALYGELKKAEEEWWKTQNTDESESKPS